MNFLEAIKEGIEASNSFDRNKEEIFSIFSDVNEAAFNKTGKEQVFFLIKDRLISSGFFECISLGEKAYPVTLQLHGNRYNCHDSISLKNTLHELLSSASCGFYIKKLLSEN